MENDDVGKPSDWCYDNNVLASKANAANDAERQEVFRYAVDLLWVARTIGMIRRVESGDRHHYAAWYYPRGADVSAE